MPKFRVLEEKLEALTHQLIEEQTNRQALERRLGRPNGWTIGMSICAAFAGAMVATAIHVMLGR